MTGDEIGSFWQWSKAVYDRNGLKGELLALQDNYGLNINILLWSMWTATRHKVLETIIFKKAISLIDQWHNSVTEPLRTARRGVQKTNMNSDETLYIKIKAIELDAEHREQEVLEKLALENCEPAPPDDNNWRRRVVKNLVTYVSLTDAARIPGFSVSMLENLATRIDKPGKSNRREA